jgi:hypothetical protein
MLPLVWVEPVVLALIVVPLVVLVQTITGVTLVDMVVVQQVEI